MTAEIAILNSFGVALAADSAVTRMMGDKAKIYNGSNKLFALTKYHPIGIMVFGNATLNGLPWETIIKLYRRSLEKKDFNTVEDYADHFFSSLCDIISNDQQVNYFRSNTRQLFRSIQVNIMEEVKKLGEISGDQIREITSNDINQAYEFYLNQSIDKTKINQKLMENTTLIVDELIKEIFEKLPLSNEDIKKLKLLSSLIFTNNSTGIVIAGFGKDEVYPSLVEMEVSLIVNENIIGEKIGSRNISFDHQALIIPFAHGSMVHTFMQGVNPLYNEVVEKTIGFIINEYPKTLLEIMEQMPSDQKEKIEKQFQSVSEDTIKTITSELNKYRRSEFVDPVLEAVGFLPKDELAIMAETLVNLTSFKLKMSIEDAEVVGGPIDVAVISKGDGFVWIKRKHYFPAELNHQFFNNYFIEQSNREESYEKNQRQ